MKKIQREKEKGRERKAMNGKTRGGEGESGRNRNLYSA